MKKVNKLQCTILSSYGKERENVCERNRERMGMKRNICIVVVSMCLFMQINFIVAAFLQLYVDSIKFHVLYTLFIR